MLGTILGAVGGGIGQSMTNEANKNITTARNFMEVEQAGAARTHSTNEALANRAFQRQMIGNQMGFQERMSSTAVQRRMDDMKQAGINPILAGKFDASSPSGGTASGSQGPTAKANAHGYTAGNVIGAAMDRSSLRLDLKQKKKNIENTEAQTDLTDAKRKIMSPASTVGDTVNEVLQDLSTSAKSYYQGAKVRVPKLNERIKKMANDDWKWPQWTKKQYWLNKVSK